MSTVGCLAASATIAAAVACTTGCVASAVAAFGLFFVADAFHHFTAGGFGGGCHHFAAGGLACTTPDGLAAHGDGFGPLAGFGAKALDGLHFDALLGEAFDFLHEAFFVHAHQVDRFAAGTRTACATDAVNVVFGHVGNFVIHDMRQVVDVDATGCDVGGHQGADVAALEASQGLGAGSLAFVAVQGHRIDAVFGQEFGHVVGTEFGACEHQHLAPVVLVDDVCQHGLLFAPAHGVDALGDALYRGVARSHLDALRVAQQGVGQFTDFVAERG